MIIGSAFSELDQNCFSGCSRLQSVTFQESTQPISIGSEAFLECESLNTLELGRPISSTDFPGWTNINHLILTSDSFSSSYSVFSECQTDFDIQFTPRVLKIPQKCFASWKKIIAATFSENLQTIEDNAFESTNINTLNLLDCRELIYIGEKSFSNCENLCEIYLPYQLKNIGIGCFQNCISMNCVSLPMSLEEVNTSLFENCTKLKAIILHPNLENINSRSFFNTSFESVRILPSVTVHPEAFANCFALRSVELFDFAVISPFAFKQSSNIVRIVLYESVDIQNFAFEDTLSSNASFFYFGMTKEPSENTTTTLKGMGINVLNVMRNYTFDDYCDIKVTKVCPDQYSTDCTHMPVYNMRMRYIAGTSIFSLIFLFNMLNVSN